MCSAGTFIQRSCPGSRNTHTRETRSTKPVASNWRYGRCPVGRKPIIRRRWGETMGSMLLDLVYQPGDISLGDTMCPSPASSYSRERATILEQEHSLFYLSDILSSLDHILFFLFAQYSCLYSPNTLCSNSSFSEDLFYICSDHFSHSDLTYRLSPCPCPHCPLPTTYFPPLSSCFPF